MAVAYSSRLRTGASGAALAAERPSTTAIAELTVTATKRQELLVNVPVAASALGYGQFSSTLPAPSLRSPPNCRWWNSRRPAAAPRAVTGFYVASLALALAADRVAGLGPLFTVGALIAGLHLAWQARRVRVDDPASALALFKSNAVSGLLLTSSIVAGLWRP
jgi:hypothetical protein